MYRSLWNSTACREDGQDFGFRSWGILTVCFSGWYSKEGKGKGLRLCVRRVRLITKRLESQPRNPLPKRNRREIYARYRFSRRISSV